MKSVNIIINTKFRIAIMVVGVILILGVIAFIIFWNTDRLRGNISVTVNREEYLPEDLKCGYENGTEEEVIYRSADSGIAFKNSGSRYGMYEYSFSINNGEISVEPKICVFKTNWYRIYVVNMEIDLYEDNGLWNADVLIETNLTTYQETFYDIENNGIEMRVE